MFINLVDAIEVFVGERYLKSHSRFDVTITRDHRGQPADVKYHNVAGRDKQHAIERALSFHRKQQYKATPEGKADSTLGFIAYDSNGRFSRVGSLFGNPVYRQRRAYKQAIADGSTNTNAFQIIDATFDGINSWDHRKRIVSAERIKQYGYQKALRNSMLNASVYFVFICLLLGWIANGWVSSDLEELQIAEFAILLARTIAVAGVVTWISIYMVSAVRGIRKLLALLERDFGTGISEASAEHKPSHLEE